MSKRAKASLLRARASAKEAMRQRIVLAIRESGVPRAHIEAHLGVDKSRVSRWANPDPNKGEMPSEDYLPLLTELLDVNGHWLLTGQGEKWRRERRVAAFDIRPDDPAEERRRNERIVLRYAVGRSIGEIADEFGLREWSVRRIVERAGRAHEVASSRTLSETERRKRIRELRQEGRHDLAELLLRVEDGREP